MYPETTWCAGDYLFYPKGFLHSPDDATDVGAHILIRLSGPMSYVNGELPNGRAWTRNDERQMLPGQSNSRRPISRLRTADLAWEELMLDGEKTGERIKVLSEDRRTRAVTFLYQVQAGWRSSLPARQSNFVRETYVVEGDLATGGADSVTLCSGDYRCVAPGEAIGGETEGSQEGCLALCWSDGPLDHIDGDGSTRIVTLG